MARWVAALFVLGVAVSACDAPLPEGGRLTVDAVEVFTADQACGPAKAAAGESIPATAAIDGNAAQALDALASSEEGRPFADGYDYGIFSRTDDDLILLGTAPRGRFAYATFRRTGDAWRPQGWGGCRWQPDGWQLAKWQVDGGLAFDAKAEEVRLVAADNCGGVAKGKELAVGAKYTRRKLRFEVWESTILPGGAFEDLVCPLDGTVQLTVRLPRPIGDRTIAGEYTDLSGFPDQD
jgi:hypothetical protein